MPPSSQTPVGTPPARILLIEEYKALAIAFGSALKKFAPNAETRIVSSLSEADKLLDDLRPTLLVLDCDPPPLHCVAFFNRLRSLLPTARVLIVAAENADEFTDHETIRPALEFIKKPFELTRFGAVIDRLLSPDAPESGTVQHLRLLDMILLHAITGAQAVLRVDAAGGQSGEIHFGEGRIVHAVVLGKSGLEALQMMLRWRAPRFSEGKRALDAPRTIHGAWAPILRAASLHILPDVQSTAQPLVRRTKRKNLSAKKILVVDDTDLLLVFVEEVLVTAHPELEIITALSGFDGLKRAVADAPDLLLLDYSLPDLTGGDVCAKLLENETTARIPVIMMSGHVPEMMAAAERFPNIVATISKPFVSAALIELIERTLAELPKFAAPFTKKKSIEAAVPEKRERRVEPSPRLRNGRAKAKKASVPAPEILPPPEPPPGLAEAHIPASILDPTPSTEAEIEFAATPSKPATEEPEDKEEIVVESQPEVAPSLAAHIPAAIKSARFNAVVLGLPLEVSTLKLSPRLRVTEISARPFSLTVSLHVLPDALPQAPGADKLFRLTNVQLDQEGQIDVVRIAPAEQTSFRPQRYALTIDGVSIQAVPESETLLLTPRATAPIRLELLMLFELSTVELAPDFSVKNLVLRARDKRMRATLLSEAVHIGATFTTAEVSLGDSGTIREIRLRAV